jgi:hypothetical protein
VCGPRGLLGGRDTPLVHRLESSVILLLLLPSQEVGSQLVGSCTCYVAGEIAPSGDSTGEVASAIANASCEADATCTSNRPSTDETLKRRSSSSSPRSQDGGGLFDRLLGNIAGSLSMKRANSAATVSQPTCLICLENLGPDDFEVRSSVHVLVGTQGSVRCGTSKGFCLVVSD